MPTNPFKPNLSFKRRAPKRSPALQRLRSAAIAGAVALQLLGLNALPHWGYGTAIALSGVIASSAAQAQDSGGGGGAGGTGGSGDAGDSGPGTGGPEYGGGGGGDGGTGGGGTGGGDTGGGGTGGTGGSGGAGGDNANSSSGSNTGSNGGGYGGGYSNANSGANGEGYGAATTTADANTGMAGTNNAPGPSASENSEPGQEGVTNSNAPADPNAPGVAGFFGGDLNAPGAAPTGIAGLGVSTGQALGNSPAPSAITNESQAVQDAPQAITTEISVETAITPQQETPIVGLCGGSCPGFQIAMPSALDNIFSKAANSDKYTVQVGVGAGATAIFGADGSAGGWLSVNCGCISGWGVYASGGPTAGLGVSLPGLQGAVQSGLAGTGTSSAINVSAFGQSVAFDMNGNYSGVQIAIPDRRAGVTVGGQGTVTIDIGASVGDFFRRAQDAVRETLTYIANTYTPRF